MIGLSHHYGPMESARQAANRQMFDQHSALLERIDVWKSVRDEIEEVLNERRLINGSEKSRILRPLLERIHEYETEAFELQCALEDEGYCFERRI